MTDNNSINPKRGYLHDEPNAAADLIRKKIATLYKLEPDAIDETLESAQLPHLERSKHQNYMYELSTSGRPLAEIQTAWHAYYIGLSDKEKHEVWQEFYAASHTGHTTTPKQPVFHTYTAPAATPYDLPHSTVSQKQRLSGRTVADIKRQITHKIRTRNKLSKKQHLQSLIFGLSMGSVVILFLLFGFFNERVIAPFISPSRTVSATPLILDGSSNAVSGEPKVVIPKINLEVPVVYDVPTIEEAAIQKGLERGAVHYATTSNPGEQGNAVIFGHSSNNILNHGKFKFAFVLLSRLEVGDTFYLQKDGLRYTYKIFEKKIVKPTDTSVLNPTPGKTATATLITCDPPGTSVNRLIVTGEQISPNPLSNLASTALVTDQIPDKLAGNAPSLWNRIWNSIF